MKRIPTAELLDSDAGTPEEIAASFSDLRRINRWFGGIATTRALVERIAAEKKAHSLSLLEIAAGSGDVPRIVRSHLRRRGLDLNVTLLDRATTHLENGNGARESRIVAGDALAIPFADSSFDLVSCGVFVHDLAPEEVLRFVGEALRVCRIAVLINDLVRHRVHLALVYAATPLYRGRLTRHDAPASVRQAYTPGEMRSLLARTKVARVEIRRHFLFRMGVIAWK